jgi:hypothetical protein
MIEKMIGSTLELGERPLQHRFGRLMAGIIAGFVASAIAEKTYDAWYKRIS